MLFKFLYKWQNIIEEDDIYNKPKVLVKIMKLGVTNMSTKYNGIIKKSFLQMNLKE